jgi:hypothetical protein
MDPGSPRVELGTKVQVELIGLDGTVEPAEFILVASKQADLRAGLLDEAAPLGAALMGRSAGEVVPYARGDLKEVRILSVEAGVETASPEAAEQRRRAVRKAAAQSEITSQMIFATASGSKWGEYDVDVEKWIADQPEENAEDASGEMK